MRLTCRCRRDVAVLLRFDRHRRQAAAGQLGLGAGQFRRPGRDVLRQRGLQERGARFRGAAAAAVERAARQFESAHGAQVLAAAEADRLWQQVRDQDLAFFRQDAGSRAAGQRLWRLSLPSTADALTLAGEQLIEWGGALRWLWSDADASRIREQAVQRGGSAMLYRGALREHECSSGQASRFHPLDATVWGFHQRLKAELDPQGLFNPSRMYPGL